MNVVTGKRRPFYTAYLAGSWTAAVLELGSPLIFLGAVFWFVHVARRGQPFSAEHTGSTVVGSIVFGIVAIVGLVGMWMLARAARTVVLDSACPVCGAQAQRSFFDPTAAGAKPAACGACLAYLRAKGDQVSEERAEAVDRILVPYELSPASYVPVARRDARNRFAFAMPPMCAICGAEHAPKHREISGPPSGDLGVVGAAISAGAADLDPQHQYTQHAAPGTSRTSTDDLDLALAYLKVPVCAQHTAEEDEVGNALEYSAGQLKFASYRYYRAFCELNQIALKSVISATGAPAASSPQ